jgi:hypothetical protein
MQTTHHEFRDVHAYGRADVRCRGCKKILSKRVTDYATINPFNKNDAGEVRTYDEVKAQAEAGVAEKVKTMEAEGRICVKCSQKEAPSYEHKALPYLAMAATQEAEIELGNTIQRTTATANYLLKDKDILIKHRLAKITFVSFHDRFVIGYRFYSKSSHAVPGELLTEEHFTRLDSIDVLG